MKNLFIIPTDKPSKLFIWMDTLLKINIEATNQGSNQNIYITSDEEIGTDEYYFHLENNEFYNSGRINEPDKDMKFWRKIILTTDQDLIKDGVQAIDDEFLKWFVAHPSCEEVEVKIEILYEHKDTYRPYPSECKNLTKTKVNYYLSIIPKEQPKIKDKILSETSEEVKQRVRDTANKLVIKQETLEEAAEKWYDSTEENKGFPKMKAFIAGAKWQASKMYSEEDMKLAFEAGHKKGFSGYPNTENWKELPFKEWFEQFKKK